ncbi:MAG: endonuclease/exonuclease/phosphatase family protein [Candidatus Binatia bacterium]
MMRLSFSFALVLMAAAPSFAVQPLEVMTYNILHGQPCSGGSLGSEVEPRMELAVQGGAGGEPGLAALGPDILGMQEVSQVFFDQPVAENQACLVLGLLPPPIGGLPPGLTTIEAYEHAADYLVRRLNGVTPSSPYKMRFERDNPRVLPLLPDVPLAPDEKSFSDLSAEMSDLEIGLALISKFRIQLVTVHNLTIGEVPGETRAILHATVRVRNPDGSETPVDFYDSHLTTTGGDSPQTVVMAAEIVRFIKSTRRHPENPGFFTCDCNAEPDSLTHQLFAAAGFVDTFAKASSDPGFTSGRDGLSTDCSQTATERIDYVWALPDSQGRIPQVLSSAVVMDYSVPNPVLGGCRFPSDHDGVLTTFDFATRVLP